MNELNAEQELQFIKQIMEDSRKVVDDGRDMIVWGVLVAAGMVINFINFEFQQICSDIILWIVIIAVGWFFSFWSWKRKQRTKPVRTFGVKILSNVWLSCGIAMTIIGFVFPLSGMVSDQSIMPLLAMILGIGYFISGAVQDERWVKNLAFGWWGGAMCMVAIQGAYMYLLFGAMITLFQTIPGVIFFKNVHFSASKENK